MVVQSESIILNLLHVNPHGYCSRSSWIKRKPRTNEWMLSIWYSRIRGGGGGGYFHIWWFVNGCACAIFVNWNPLLPQFSSRGPPSLLTHWNASRTSISDTTSSSSIFLRACCWYIVHTLSLTTQGTEPITDEDDELELNFSIIIIRIDIFNFIIITAGGRATKRWNVWVEEYRLHENDKGLCCFQPPFFLKKKKNNPLYT